MQSFIALKISRVLLVLTLCLMSGGNPVWACSCAWKGDFVEYAKVSEGVIHARVTAYGDRLSHGETFYESMTVEIIEVIAGDIDLESVVLTGDPGMLCLDYVNSENFIVGNEYLFALHEDKPVQPFGGCGEAWMAVKGAMVHGKRFTDTDFQDYSLPLKKLISKIRGR